MRIINTSKNPDHCPKCMSNNIVFLCDLFKKDKNGKDTNIPILGTWMCNECGNTIGRRMNELENEIYENDL